MSLLMESIVRLEHLLNKVAHSELDEVFLETWEARWHDEMEALAHCVDSEYTDEDTLKICRKRLAALIARLPEVEQLLNIQLSEVSRMLYQENQREALLEKANQAATGRVIYRKA